MKQHWQRKKLPKSGRNQLLFAARVGGISSASLSSYLSMSTMLPGQKLATASVCDCPVGVEALCSWPKAHIRALHALTVAMESVARVSAHHSLVTLIWWSGPL